MSDQPITAAVIISFVEKLEDGSAALYRELAHRFPQHQPAFEGYASDCAKSKVQVQRTYQETVTDALETGYSFAGLDLGGQYAKGVKEYLGKINFAYVIIVCDRAEKTCPTAFPRISQQRLFWPFEDPVVSEGTKEEKLAKFREIRDQIDRRIRQWLSELA